VTASAPSIETLTAELMEVHRRLSVNGPSAGDPEREAANAALRERLVALHAVLLQATRARDRELFG
jgi:hypothetical protein